MERAKELGRNLLSMARGGSGEEDDRQGAPKRRSWSDVVSNSPQPVNSSPVRARTEKRVEAGMPKPSSSANNHCSPRRVDTPQKIFSADEVARLVEIARHQLRKEKEMSSGWKEVTSKESKNREKNYARDLVEGYRSSPESPFRCWQCDLPGHKSADCPQGERCFTCNSQGHKRAECPLKWRASRKEKGKAIEAEEDVQRRRPSSGIHIGDHWPRVGKGHETTKHLSNQHNAGENKKHIQSNTEKEWRVLSEAKGKSPIRPGRLIEASATAGEANRIPASKQHHEHTKASRSHETE